jgi:hypothetical protein
MGDFRSEPHQTSGIPEAEVTQEEHVTNEDELAERAARLASEVSEARTDQQRRRLLAPFTAATRTASKSAADATRSAGKSAADVTRSAGKSAGKATRSASKSAAEATRSAGKSAADATRSAAEATRGVALSAARTTGRGVRAARRGIGGGTGWLTGQVLAMAPRLRVRDQAALQAQFPGRSAEQIADALVDGAARASAAVGGAVGAWSALPALPAWPAEIATETLALVGIEIKLVAELHEAYGMPAQGTGMERATAYVAAWANRRGVALVPGGLVLAAGSPLVRRLRWRLAARAGRTAFSLAPLFTGAAAGALLNRRETRKLGEDIRADLRGRVQPAWLAGPRPSAPRPSAPRPAASPDG